MSRNLFFMGSGIVLLAILSRFLPHPPNFAPITAVALFGSVWFTNKYIGLLLPLAIMLFSDLFLGFHNTLFFVYGSFMLISALGLLLKKNYSFGKSLAFGLTGSVLFFLITNFGVWLTSGGFYPNTMEGLMECYIAAIPFFQNTILGDVVYVSALFGFFEFAKRRIPELSAAH